jgi:hypothetical protein
VPSATSSPQTGPPPELELLELLVLELLVLELLLELLELPPELELLELDESVPVAPPSPSPGASPSSVGSHPVSPSSP